ncbi:TPA: hypothetical protein BOS_4318 [Bos taurus]|nr:TPA: hypothetical protein BOS_4318 [Bos taurus]
MVRSHGLSERLAAPPRAQADEPPPGRRLLVWRQSWRSPASRIGQWSALEGHPGLTHPVQNDTWEEGARTQARPRCTWARTVDRRQFRNFPQRCASRNRCSPAKPIAAAGLPWRLRFPGAAATVARSSKCGWIRLEGPAVTGEKTSAHLLVIRQVILETRTPGQREGKKKKELRRRPLQPQVQVESSRSRPPGTRLDQVAYVAPALGCLIGERLRVRRSGAGLLEEETEAGRSRLQAAVLEILHQFPSKLGDQVPIFVNGRKEKVFLYPPCPCPTSYNPPVDSLTVGSGNNTASFQV